MIVYDLRCDKGHTFEGWFNDGKAFENQKRGKLITCPVCGSDNINMILPSLTRVGKSGDRESGSKEITFREAIDAARNYIDKHFEDVGDRFAEIALNIHRNKEPKKNIKGTTTQNEEELLKEEGVDFIKIPIPKYDS